MTTLDHSIAPSLRFSNRDYGLSKDASLLRKAKASAAPARTSIALGSPESRLRETIAEASTDDWDGYGARPVSAQTAEFARRLLRVLPYSASDVDIQADPCGDILFEWAISPQWILTLSIDARGQLAYSGLFGTNSIRGIEDFEHALPPSIALARQRLFDRKKMVEAWGGQE